MNGVLVGAPNRLYRNGGNANHWMIVQLKETVSNRDGIGARLIAVTGTKRQRRDVEGGGSGYDSQPSLPVEFGFGSTATVDSLIIRWPSGIVQTLTNVATNQRLTLQESRDPHPTAVEDEAGVSGRTEGQRVPVAYTLFQNIPNPFNPETTISFELPEAAGIRLSISNLTGQELCTLVQGTHQPGRYSVVWDGRDMEGREVASGIYLYCLEVVGRGIVETKRMVLVR